MTSSIENVLASTQQALSSSGIERELWPAAFSKVFDLLIQETSSHEEKPSGSSGTSPNSSLSKLELISQRMKIPLEVTQDLFYLEGDLLGVTLPTQRLDRSKKSATKQIALIVAAGRQAAELEEWTATAMLRETCEDYGKLDTPNFAATIASMDDVFQTRGKGQARAVRVRRPGFERAKELVVDLLGVGA